MSQHPGPLPVLAGEVCTPGLGSGVDGSEHQVAAAELVINYKLYEMTKLIVSIISTTYLKEKSLPKKTTARK